MIDVMSIIAVAGFCIMFSARSIFNQLASIIKKWTPGNSILSMGPLEIRQVNRKSGTKTVV